MCLVDNKLGLLCTIPTSATLFAQKGGGGGDGGAAAGMLGTMACCGIFWLVIVLVFVIAAWKLFTKAGRPGWESIVPIYNNWIMVTEVCKLEPLWFFLGFVPLVNLFAAWKVCMELAKKFGKSDMFGMGLFFLGVIFFPMLAFSDAKYQGKKKKKYDDEDEEEEEERPRRSRRDDDEEEERPRRSRRDDD
jgi:hypothetical protein